MNRRILSIIMAATLVACSQNTRLPPNLDYEQRWQGGELTFFLSGTNYQCFLSKGNHVQSCNGKIPLAEAELVCLRFRNANANWKKERIQLGGSSSVFLTDKVGPYPVVRVGFSEDNWRYSLCEVGAESHRFVQIFRGTVANQDVQRLLKGSFPGTSPVP